MKSYSSSYVSSKSSHISKNTKKTNGSMKHEYPFQSHNYSWLHSVRKSPTKTWNKKAPIAPMAPTPVKVYKVDPINFKELVQSLTCDPQFMPPQSHHKLDLQSTTDHTTTASDIVPSLAIKKISSIETVDVSPPLVPVITTSTNSWYHYFQAEYFGKNSEEEEVMTPGLLEMNLFSPTSFGNWCFVPPIISPGV